MLKTLYLKNFAIVEELSITFKNNFTVITGETGAGKSIIANAFLLFYGAKFEDTYLKDKNQKAIIEATFELNNKNTEEWLKQNDIECNNEIILRRELLPSGNTRQYINDTIVTLSQLKELTLQLIDVHSQHHNVLLKKQFFQLQIVDTWANLQSEVALYKAKYSEYKELTQKIKNLTKKQEEENNKIEFWLHQKKELENIVLSVEEFNELETEFQTFEHIEEILEKLSEIYLLLNENENAINNQLKSVLKTTQTISLKYPKAVNWLERLQSVYQELKDITYEISQSHHSFQVNPYRYQQIQTQIDTIYNLMHKYRLNSYSDLLNFKKDIEQKLSVINNLEEEINSLKEKLLLLENDIKQMANILHEKRTKAALTLEKPIVQKLQMLGMPHAQIIINVEKNEILNENGVTEIIFLFSANKKISPQPLDKIASGGELSRILLTLKCLLINDNYASTLLLDEADTGISGEIAYKAGNIIRELGEHKQVIAITHLPQVAACANYHLMVQKITTINDTKIIVTDLSVEDKINEIARLLSADKITSAAVEQAKHLLKNS